MSQGNRWEAQACDQILLCLPLNLEPGQARQAEALPTGCAREAAIISRELLGAPYLAVPPRRQQFPLAADCTRYLLTTEKHLPYPRRTAARCRVSAFSVPPVGPTSYRY